MIDTRVEGHQVRVTAPIARSACFTERKLLWRLIHKRAGEELVRFLTRNGAPYLVKLTSRTILSSTPGQLDSLEMVATVEPFVPSVKEARDG